MTTDPPSYRGPIEVSVVLPAYNEAATITDAVERTLGTLESFLPAGTFEVIVASDGCTDHTTAIAGRLAAADDRVRLVDHDERLGRGGALESAFRAADGDTLVYLDSDLATDMSHLEALVEPIRSGSADVVTGSRRLPDNRADRPAKRAIASWGFNGFVRLLLGSRLRDHQCGFKSFDRSALFDLLEEVEDRHWFWDTEVLVHAQRVGYRVREIPVDWDPQGDSKVEFVRDVVGMGGGVVRMWWQFEVEPRLTPRVTVAAGTMLSVVALALMTIYLDPAVVLAELRRVDPVYVALATVVYLVSWPLRGARYRDILAELGFHERVGFLTGAVFISQMGNLVFPARAGDAIRAYLIKSRRSIPYPSGFASLVVERVYDLLTITVLAGVVVLGLAASGGLEALVATISAAGRPGRLALLVASVVAMAAVVVTVAIVATARSDRQLVRRVMPVADASIERLVGRIEQFVGDLQRGAGSLAAFARIGTTSLYIWILDVMTAILVLAAFGDHLSLLPLVGIGFFAVSVGNLAKVLPLSPGGIGLYEAGFTLIVAGMTPIAAPVAFGAAVIDHAVKNGVTVVGGAGAMIMLNVSLTTAVGESAEAEERRGYAGLTSLE